MKVSDQNDINTRWKRGQGSVAIIWRKHFKVQRLLVGDDRVAAIKIRTNNESFVFCSVYLPSTNSSPSEFMKSLKCLEDICVNLNYRQEKVVVAGDFNAHLFDARSRQPENNRGKIILDICTKLDLFPVNIDMPCKGPLFTNVSSCVKSVVDYICMSNCMRTNVNCIEVVDEHPCNLSHHLPLTVTINVDGDITDERIFNKLGRKYERIAWKKSTLEHSSEFERRLNDAVVEVDDTLAMLMI